MSECSGCKHTTARMRQIGWLNFMVFQPRRAILQEHVMWASERERENMHETAPTTHHQALDFPKYAEEHKGQQEHIRRHVGDSSPNPHNGKTTNQRYKCKGGSSSSHPWHITCHVP
eukprot:2758804-Amphidinium_carterae.2